MASSTEIANLALSHLAVAQPIANLTTERSTTAAACRTFYSLTRELVLRQTAWPFANVVETLGLVETDPNDEWGYSYRYPATASRLIRIPSGIRNDTRQKRVPYKIGRDASGKLIYTDMEDALIEYTRLETDEDRYPPDFIMAMSLRLAAYIAPRVTGGDPFKLGQRAMQMYMLEFGLATANAGNEDQPDELPESEYIASRE